MKKIIQRLLAILLILNLVACEKDPADSQTGQSKTAEKIVLGSVGSDVQIWQYIAASQQARDLGLNIEVKEINDGVALNQAVLDQEIDVNAFQSWAYFKAFNQLHNHQLQAIATTYLEPMGLYSKRYKALQDLPEGAVVAIPNDVANTSRALKLLAQAKLIELKPSFNSISGSVNDIQKNPKNIRIKTVKGAQGPRVLDEVDVVAIGNTTALESGLNVLKDSIAHETVQDKIKENINLLVVHKNNANDRNLNKLNQLYHQPFVTAYIDQHFGGTKLEIDQPVATLN